MTPCLDCGQPGVTGRGTTVLCVACQRRRTNARTHYKGDWAKLSRRLRQSASRCAICRQPFTPDNPATLDHVAPRSRAAGLQVLCRRCNSRKGART